MNIFKKYLRHILVSAAEIYLHFIFYENSRSARRDRRRKAPEYKVNKATITVATWRVNTRLYCDKFTMPLSLSRYSLSLSFSRSEGSLSRKREAIAEATPCILDGFSYCRGNRCSLNRSIPIFACKMAEEPGPARSYFSGGSETSLGSSAFKTSRAIFNGRNPPFGMIYDKWEEFACVYARVQCACLKLVALAGPMGAGEM